MEKKVVLNENQIKLLQESMFRNIRTFSDLLNAVKKAAYMGILTTSLVGGIIHHYKLNDKQAEEIAAIADDYTNKQEDTNPWVLACGGAMATVYNAVAEQCNDDCGRTASMFRLNLKNPYSHRIIAIERTMMDRYGLQMGDVVYLEGVGKYDGVWQVQDKMNKRFAGMDKIDLLVNNDTKTGKWDNVKIYTLKDKSLTSQYKSELAPQLSKDAFNAQFKKKV